MENKGFMVLGFPCNQFGKQEPGSNKDIKAFAKKKYGVTFPLFEKTEVNGPNAHPVWQFLKGARPSVHSSPAVKARDQINHGGADITWNFNKFLVDATGRPVKRYPSAMDAHMLKQIRKDVNAMLSA